MPVALQLNVVDSETDLKMVNGSYGTFCFRKARQTEKELSEREQQWQPHISLSTGFL